MQRTQFCAAPSASMYFDQFGQAKACCQQSQDLPLGNVSSGGILEVWNGERSKLLRTRMYEEDLDIACGFGRWQRHHAPAKAVFARTFDHLEPGPHEYPRQLEFAVSSVCNLQCVMCDGDFSSSIRVHRDGLRARPEVYQEAFFQELIEIMPHVESVRMYGGEPFLALPSLRVLDIVAVTNPQTRVSITTNATVWNRRVEYLLNETRPSVVVSLDAMTRETYEDIRCGASFDKVLANIDRYEQAGAQISLAFCLMTENAHEFVDLLTFGTDRGFSVGVNTVLKPERLSLYDLPSGELHRVVEGLKSQAHKLDQSPHLELLRQQIHDLDAFLASDESQVTIRNSRPWDAIPADLMIRTDDTLYQRPPGTDLPADTVEIIFHKGFASVLTGSAEEILGVAGAGLTGLDGAGLMTALSVDDSRVEATTPRAILTLSRLNDLPPLRAEEHSDRWWVSRL